MFAVFALVIGLASPAWAGGKVLFYMHGSDMHGKDSGSAGMKNYQGIIKQFEDNGLEVVFELRNTHAADEQAAKTAKMVKDRIAAGTAPEDIIVGGFSYGSMIALKASGLIDDSRVNYALFTGCPEKPSIPVDIDYAKVKGRVLSITDTGDAKFGTCKKKLSSGDVTLKEVEITSGKGHKVFKLPKGKFTKHWLPTFIDWAG